VRKSGLRDVKPGRCCRKRPFLGDGNEILELFDIHGPDASCEHSVQLGKVKSFPTANQG
jgi:hypothetical protein